MNAAEQTAEASAAEPQVRASYITQKYGMTNPRIHALANKGIFTRIKDEETRVTYFLKSQVDAYFAKLQAKAVQTRCSMNGPILDVAVDIAAKLQQQRTQ